MLALGPLSTPRLSDTKGLDTFKGKLLHSSQWEPHTDLSNLRVGVVGTGATAVQLVPEIAKVASKVCAGRVRLIYSIALILKHTLLVVGRLAILCQGKMIS